MPLFQEATERKILVEMLKESIKPAPDIITNPDEIPCSLKATQCIEPKNLWLPEKHQRFPQLLSQSKPDQALNYRQQPWQKWEANEAAGSLNKQTKTYQDFPFDGGGVGDAKKDDGKKNVPNWRQDMHRGNHE